MEFVNTFEDIKIEIQEISLKKEGFDEIKFGDDSFNETSYCVVKEEIGSVKTKEVSTINDNSCQDVKQESHDLPIEKADNNETIEEIFDTNSVMRRPSVIIYDDNFENSEDIKIEINELSAKIEENHDDENKLQEDSINETSYSTVNEEMRVEETDLSKEQNSTGASDGVFDDLQSFQWNIREFNESNENNSNSHRKEKHSNNEILACNSTDRKSSTKLFLNNNIKYVHEESSKRSSCHSCDYKTNVSTNLKNHIERIHLKLKKFQCYLCHFRAGTKWKLKIHIESIHLKLKKYQCHLCDYETFKKELVKVHIDRIHLKLKKFECYLCNLRAFSKKDLKIHIERIHLKLRKYQCHLCDYKALQINRLQLHINSVHLKLKRYQCHLCDFKTSYKNSLKKHIEGQHLKLKKSFM